MPPNAPIQLEQFGTRFQCSRKAKKILNGFDFNSTSNNDTINQCCVEVCLRIMIPFYSMVGPFGVGCGKRYQLIQSYQK